MRHLGKRAVQKMKYIQKGIVGILIVALLAGQVETLNVSASAKVEMPAEKTETVISSFTELPETVREQTVPVGTAIEELVLPDTLEAVALVETEETESTTPAESPAATETPIATEVPTATVTPAATMSPEASETPEDGASAAPVTSPSATESPEDAAGAASTESPSAAGDGEGTTGSDAEEKPESVESNTQTQTEDFGNLEAETVTETLKEVYSSSSENLTIGTVTQDASVPASEDQTIEGITWTSMPEYDGESVGEYIFTAVLPEAYVLAEGVSLPQITVTVVDEEQIAVSQISGWYFGEEDVYPKGDLFLDEGSYSLVLAGGSSEIQIPFDEIIELLPDSVMAELTCPKTEVEANDIAAEADSATADNSGESAETEEKILPIVGWECAEYVQDKEGYLPYRGEFVFRAQIGADEEGRMYEMAEGTESVNVWLVFDAPMMMASVKAVPGTITSNQEWGTQTLAAGTYIINPGVTVTVSGKLTIEGNVTIKGGGTLCWTSAGANAMEVREGAQVELENVILDGNNKSFSYSAFLFQGKVTLKNGTVIKNFKSRGGSGAYAGYKGVIAVYQNGVLNIEDGVTITKNACESGIIALYQYDTGGGLADSTATVNMYGGTINGNTVKTSISNMGVIWNWCGNLNIYGGTVIAEGGEYAVHTQGNYNAYNAKTVISGGTFTGVKNGAVCAGKDSNNRSEIRITGGIFSGKTAATVNYGTIEIRGGTYNGDEYALSSNGNGSLEVYGGEFSGSKYAYSGNITTQTNKVIVGSAKETAANWDKKTSLNTYKYVAIGEIVTFAYSITYNKNDGIIEDESNYTSYIYGTGLTLPTPTRTGYTFGGWYTDAGFTGSAVTKISATDTGNKNYYAKWTAKKYTVKFDYQGATGGNSTTSLSVTDNSAYGTLPTPVKTGYTFKGWYTQAGGGGSKITDTTVVNATGDHILYAYWKDETAPVIGELTYENKVTNLLNWIIGKKSLIIRVPVVDAGSGVTQITYTATPMDADGNPDSSRAETKKVSVTKNGNGETEAKITFAEDFKGTIIITCSDAAGNTADSVTVGTNGGGVIVEDNAPKISFAVNGGAISENYYDKAPDILVSVSDDRNDGSSSVITGGIKAVTWQIGSGTVKNDDKNYAASMVKNSTFTIKASEIPTGETKIIVTATDNAGNEASKSVTVRVKGPEAAPGAVISFMDETLTGLVANAEYKINNVVKTADENGNIRFEEEWYGQTIEIVKSGNGKDKTDSSSQSLAVPARPQAPKPSTAGESGSGKNNGSISNLTPGEVYEISADGGTTWEDVEADEGGQIKDLKPGNYEIRVKAKDDTFYSESVKVSVPAYPSQSGDSGSGEGGDHDGNHDRDSSGSNDDSGKAENQITGKSTGKILKEVENNENAPDTQFSMTTDELAAIVLTDTERQSVEKGTNVKIFLIVEDAADSTSRQDKAIIDNEKGEFKVGQYLDISLFKIIGSSSEKIAKTNGMIGIIIDIPDELKNTSGTETREFAVIRVHNGEAVILNDLDTDEDTITVETNLFSSYALLYRDVPNNGGIKNPESTKDSEPKTGDNTHLAFYATAAMIAGLAYLRLYFGELKCGMTEEEKKELIARIIRWARRGGRLRRILAIAAIIPILMYYHSIGKKTSVKWNKVYGSQ